jgi:hypothetical protein
VTDAIIAYYGGLGVVAAAVSWYILKLQKDLNDSQERRVADAQSTTSQILDLVEQHTKSNTALAEAITANTEALRNLERVYVPTGAPPYGRG